MDFEKVIEGLEYTWEYIRERPNPTAAPKARAMSNIMDAVSLLKKIVRCNDCENKECWGRAGDVVCGIDGTPHRPDWFCADGERKD